MTEERGPESRYASLIGGATGASGLDRGAVLAALGGWWGIVESSLPAVVFIVVQTIWRSVGVSVVATAGVVVLLAIIRAVTLRGTFQSIVAGAIGASIGLVFALTSNDANNVFVPGFVVNAVYLLVFGLSAAIGHPLTGYAIGAFTGDVFGWRGDRVLRRANVIATVLFAAPSAVRLAVLLPLWLAHAEVAVLGGVKLAVGLPLTGLSLLGCYLVLRPAYVAAEAAGRRLSEADNETHS